MSGQEDYVLVPREPTEEMLEPNGDHLAYFDFHRRDDARSIYKAMLAAAPASPQPQGADGINAGSVETPGSTLGLSAEACQRSGAAGFDSLTSETLGEYKYQEPSNASVLGPITHPQPSGDGLSDETLWVMWLQECDALMPEAEIKDAVVSFARAVEARVRYQPTDEWRMAVEACARVAEQYMKYSGLMAGPSLLKKEIAAQIRALSPTKPDDGAPTQLTAKRAR